MNKPSYHPQKHIDDRIISEYTKKEINHAPESHWFIKKILNRLPEPRRIFSAVALQKVCYIVAAIILVASWSITGWLIYSNGLDKLTLNLAIITPIVTIFCIFILSGISIKNYLSR